MAPRRPLVVVEQPQARKGGGGAGKTPRVRFKELAPERVSKAVEAIRFLEKLGNPAVYSYTESEKEQILAALEKAVGGVKFVLDNPGKTPPVLFFEDDA